VCGGGKGEGDCCYAGHYRMAMDRKVHVGVQDVQLPITFQFISKSEKVRPKKLKIRNLVFILYKVQGIYFDFNIFQCPHYDFQISWEKGTTRT
jgi:hypothetical protein